jgi:RND family efflux transporter MFP subunit
MKKLIYLLLSITIISACSSDEFKKKKAELDDLKKQETEIKAKIATLEKEVAKLSGGKSIPPREVAITPIENQSFAHYIEVQAKVEGDDNVSVSSETAGTVASINVKIGDQVSKGTVLAQLDDKVYVKSLEELNLARELANTVYQKQKSLWDQKIGTEIQFLQAKNGVESLDKKIATVREQLAMTKIKSPINGVVDQMDLKLGMMMAPGMPGLRVVNFSNLKIQAEVAEAYISKVKRNDAVQINFPDVNKVLNAKVNYSGKVIDPLNRTFKVEVLVDQKEIDLFPNMVAVLKISDYTNKSAIVLPASVIQTTPEGSYVFVSDGKVATKKPVTLGKNYQGLVEVLSGLSIGDPVITTGYQDLVDGQAIKL